MKLPALSDLNAFVAVATHRNFRRAADTLGVSHSSLSHAIRNLESQLGIRLFNRTTRSVAPTPEAERLLQRLEPLLGDLGEALGAAAASGGQVSGVLRISGSLGAIRHLLDQVVPVLQSRHPRIELDLSVDGHLVDIVKQGFDAGIRLGEAVPQDMVAVSLGAPMRFLPVAAPSYLRRHAPPATPGDLLDHHCIRQRLPSGRRYRWEFSLDNQQQAIDVPGTLTLDNNALQVEAAAAGLGIAYVPETYAAPWLADGRLVALLETWCPPAPGFHLYFPANRHPPAALRALIDVIKEQASSTQRLRHETATAGIGRRSP